jgi:hypothetical protein
MHRVGDVYIVHGPLPLHHNPTKLTKLSLSLIQTELTKYLISKQPKLTNFYSDSGLLCAGLGCAPPQDPARPRAGVPSLLYSQSRRPSEVAVVVAVTVIEHHDHEQPFALFLVTRFEFCITFEAEVLRPMICDFCRGQQLGSRRPDGRWR